MTDIDYIADCIKQGKLPKLDLPSLDTEYTVNLGGSLTTFTSKREARKFREAHEWML